MFKNKYVGNGIVKEVNSDTNFGIGRRHLNIKEDDI